MPDMNQKLERFRQLVLEDAQKERGKIMEEVDQQRRQRLEAAQAEIRRRVDAEKQQKAEAIQAETGREISRRQLLLPLIFLPMPLFEQKACLLLSRFRSL